AREAVVAVEARKIIKVLREAPPAFLVDFQSRVPLGRLARLGAKRVGRHLASRETQDCTLGWYRLLTAMLQVVERWQQLARGKVAGGTEDNDRTGRHRMGFRDSPNLAHSVKSLVWIATSAV